MDKLITAVVVILGFLMIVTIIGFICFLGSMLIVYFAGFLVQIVNYWLVVKVLTGILTVLALIF